MSGSASLRISLCVLLALILALHAPVFTRGHLITPAGMHFAMWPWKAQAEEALAGGATLEENYALSDLLFQVYPWQVFTARSLETGSVPLWNPYSYSGVPFVANAQSAVFYPLHWPAWILPSMHVYTVALLLKILLAGLFMTIFLRGLGLGAAACVVGSVSFALCGFMTSWLGYAHTNAALVLPLLMHAARLLAATPGTTSFLVLAFATAAQFLGGHPETSLHVMGAASLYFLWNLRGSGRPYLSAGLFAGGSLLGTAIAAIQLFPFLGYLLESAALARRQAWPSLDPDLPGNALMALLVPNVFGRTWDFSYQGPVSYQAVAGYAGAGVLLLALFSLRSRSGLRFFQALAGLSILIVYGPPVIRSIVRAIPLLGISSNNRLLLVISFCAAVTAAHAVGQLAAERAATPRSTAATLAWMGGIAAALLAVTILWPAPEAQDARVAQAAVGGTAVLAALTILRPSRRGIYLFGLAALTCADLFLFAFRFNPHAEPAVLFPSTGMTEFIRRTSWGSMERGGRMMTVGWTMRPETQMVHRLFSIEGYDAMELGYYRELLDRAGVDAIHESGHIPESSRALLDLMGLRFLATPPGGVVSGDDLSLGYEGPDGRVFVNDRAQPRFAVVSRAAPVPDASAALDLVASGRLDRAREVVLHEPVASAPRPPAEPEGSAAPGISVETNAPGNLRLRIGGHREGDYLVVTETFDTGWEAKVNGTPAPVLRANYCFMAVKLGAAEAEVSLVYRPVSFRSGAWTSALALMFALFAGLMHLGRLKHQGRL